MTTKLKAAPDNPDGTRLPGELVRVEVLARVARKDESDEHWAWAYEITADSEAIGVSSAAFPDDWRTIWGRDRIPLTRDEVSRAYRTRGQILVVLYGYCVAADAPAMLGLLSRVWHRNEGRVVPLPGVAWMSREADGELDDYAYASEAADDVVPADDDPRTPVVHAARIAELTEIADMVGNNATWFSKLANPEPTPPAPRFLVDGLVPIGNVTLLIAARKVGKSTLLTELAGTVARRGGQWCGFNVRKEACTGFAVLLAGEDTDEVHARINAQDPLGRPARLIVPPRSGKPLGDLLDELGALAVSLLVVDPARAFMVGDEDSSDAGNTFFRQIEDFAQAKGCAAVVAQHLKKDAAPRTINEIPGCVRGTGVFLDRPRVIMGMVRAGEHTLLGIPAPAGDPLHNFRQSIMFSGQRRLIRDEATMRHLPADQSAAADAATTGAVLAAIRRCNAEGRPVSRTGKSGIFEIGPEEIRGFSRQKVRAAADALIDAGKLLDNSGELIVAAPHAG
jgi:hypothetical protein